jgi:hypothetical protein
MTIASPSSERISPFTTRAERHAAGKALRAKAPRTSHGEWASATDRPDPISLFRRVEPHPHAGLGTHPLWTHVPVPVRILTRFGGGYGKRPGEDARLRHQGADLRR